MRWKAIDAAAAEALAPYPDDALGGDDALAGLRRRYNEALADRGRRVRWPCCVAWPARRAGVDRRTNTATRVRDRELKRRQLHRIAEPPAAAQDGAAAVRGLGRAAAFPPAENLPGAYPYTGGVYPYRREAEDPIRMFAGEGMPERTNRRFHYLAAGHAATRLSTAFDSVTLYGEDPDERPDIYGRIGNSGVSIATLDDMKRLYSGFDLCDPSTSVSMTINGPAPMILAMFMNTAIDQQVEKHLRATGGWDAAQRRIADLFGARERPVYRGELPEGHDGIGLGLLGVSGDQVVDARNLCANSRGDAGPRARHGAGRHPQGGPGPEHLHFLHRIRAAHDG